MTETYVPFSEGLTQPNSVSSISDIEEYNPSNSFQYANNYHPRFTHCYVCGKGWSWGYWKHCSCNAVPVGDGAVTMLLLTSLYLVYLFKREKTTLHN